MAFEYDPSGTVEINPESDWWAKPPRFSFEPEPDITAYEVAFILRAVMLVIDTGILNKMPAEVARHFKPVKR